MKVGSKGSEDEAVTKTWRLICWIGVVLLLAGAAALLLPGVEDALFSRLVEHHLRAGDQTLLQGDGLKVLLCGTSAPFADPERVQSCVAVIAGGGYYLVDTGPGSGRNLALWQMRGRELEAVFLTHFHSDHIGDLGEVNTNAWLAGHAGSLQVFGGLGVKQVVAGFNQAYVLDQQYRTANSGPALLPEKAHVMEATEIAMAGPVGLARDRRSVPLHFGDLVVTAFEVNHDPAEPAYGYRFDYRGRSVVVSGDTRYHLPVAAAAQGADVLVHEAQSQHLVDLIGAAAGKVGDKRLAQTMGDIQHYHSDPLDAARIANLAHVRLLVLTHLNPPVANPLLSRMFYRGMNGERAHGWMSGEDGTLIVLPAGSDEVKVSRLGR